MQSCWKVFWKFPINIFMVTCVPFLMFLCFKTLMTSFTVVADTRHPQHNSYSEINAHNNTKTQLVLIQGSKMLERNYVKHGSQDHNYILTVFGLGLEEGYWRILRVAKDYHSFPEATQNESVWSATRWKCVEQGGTAFIWREPGYVLTIPASAIFQDAPWLNLQWLPVVIRIKGLVPRLQTNSIAMNLFEGFGILKPCVPSTMLRTA